MNKVFHYINVTLIFLFLIAICIIEDYYVSSSLQQAQDEVLAIERTLEETNALLDENIIMQVENLDYTWTKNEKALCFMVNHKSIQEIGVEIARLKACIVIDNKDDFRVGLEHITLYCQEYMHFMGASLENIL